jgi:peptide/nickel transport system permease protein
LVIVVLGVSVLTFFLMHLAPGDPAEQIAIARYGVEAADEAAIEVIRTREGLDAPVAVQYFKWLGHVLHGDLGLSLVDETSVSEEIIRKFPATLQLALGSLLVSLVISIPIGIIAALKQNSFVDHLSMTAALVGVSMPNFWLALLLILVFAVNLGWFPTYGRGGIEHLVLPAITLGTGMAAITTRLTRASMLEVLGQNYIRTARAKGMAEFWVICKHAFRNAVIPVITIVGLQAASLLEGAVVVETIFAWPGIGRLLVDAIYERDFAVVQGCALMIAFIFAVINLLVDISYAYLDPRIRYDRRNA